MAYPVNKLNSMINKVGVMGDIHAEDKLLATAIQFLKSKNIPTLFSVGDIVDGLGNVDRCCDLLQENQIIAVQGNHERWLFNDYMRNLKHSTKLSELSAASKNFLETLPQTYEFKTILGKGLLCHGLGTYDMGRVPSNTLKNQKKLEQLINQKYRIIINGHTHKKLVTQIKPLSIINAGTLKPKHGSGFIIIDFIKKKVTCYNITDDYSIIIKDIMRF